MSTKLEDYQYELPRELIGQQPVEPRDHARLMVVDRRTGAIEEKMFYELVDCLRSDDILVRNATKVIPARLYGHRESGGLMEILLLKRHAIDTWECLLKPAKKLKPGRTLSIGELLKAELLEVLPDGNRMIRFSYQGVFEEILDQLGKMPLPPYIVEELREKNRYQTVYALRGESVAAPTAGLHFTKDLLQKITDKGIKIVDIFLDVGLGTFRPVQTDDARDHKMHEETFEIGPEAAEIINKAKEKGQRIVSVGTTTTRALESSVDERGRVQPRKGVTGIFIYPGFSFRVIDALITNFHLPKSTLLMLVSAFSTREIMRTAYERAVREKYRFFSFGDAMFIR
ncbi:MAG: tRNA preQ1(34) S-adenosylmethionine ribosyltransferase-isomerase QueA [Fusobacteriaceae bacterium]|jgi:S-adenosylmethionine:tRNA ribosyltransferase-isomerase|nr:tRNA preQ1(34) S-adenosylmethionine ribosyltransferase-isomerase QueA [Fusobacteriaceae bacterium]